MGMSSYNRQGYAIDNGIDYTSDLDNHRLEKIKRLIGIKDEDIQREYIQPVKKSKKKKGFQGMSNGEHPSERFNELVDYNDPNAPKREPKKKTKTIRGTDNKVKVKVRKPQKKQGLTQEQKEGFEKLGNVAKKAAPFVIPVAMTWITNKMMK
jgi:hypothetical protein